MVTLLCSSRLLHPDSSDTSACIGCDRENLIATGIQLFNKLLVLICVSCIMNGSSHIVAKSLFCIYQNN